MKVKRAILIHGFNVSDGGKGSTDLLRQGLEELGLEVIEFDTKWKRGLVRDLISVRTQNGKRSRKLASIIQQGDLLIGHSNGCALIDMACWQLADLSTPAAVTALYINPALDSDAPLAPQVKNCWVMHTPSDKTVGIAGWLWASRWGPMGRDGYTGNDDRYSSMTHDHHGIVNAGHSGIFHAPRGIELIIWRIKMLIQLAENS